MGNKYKNHKSNETLKYNSANGMFTCTCAVFYLTSLRMR